MRNLLEYRVLRRAWTGSRLAGSLHVPRLFNLAISRTIGKTKGAHAPQKQERELRAKLRPRRFGTAKLSRQDLRCFVLRGVAFEKRKRKAEGQARANLVHRVSTRERMTYRDVEAEIVAHAVNQADEA